MHCVTESECIWKHTYRGLVCRGWSVRSTAMHVYRLNEQLSQNLGGVAGGTKFVVQNILFKVLYLSLWSYIERIPLRTRACGM